MASDDPQTARRVLETLRSACMEPALYYDADKRALVVVRVEDLRAALAAVPVPAPAPEPVPLTEQKYLTPAEAVTILVRDAMTHSENYVKEESGVFRFLVLPAHLNILLEAAVRATARYDTFNAKEWHKRAEQAEAENAALRAERDQLRALVEAGRQDEELLNRVQDAGLTVREALTEREALRAERERLRALIVEARHRAPSSGEQEWDWLLGELAALAEGQP